MRVVKVGRDLREWTDDDRDAVRTQECRDVLHIVIRVVSMQEGGDNLYSLFCECLNEARNGPGGICRIVRTSKRIGGVCQDALNFGVLQRKGIGPLKAVTRLSVKLSQCINANTYPCRLLFHVFIYLHVDNHPLDVLNGSFMIPGVAIPRRVRLEVRKSEAV